MANNYTKASFLIPCSAEHAALVEQAVLFVQEASTAEGNALLEKAPDTLTPQESL